MKINWTSLQKQLAIDLGVSRESIDEIRKSFFINGEIIEPINKKRRGKAAPNYKQQVLLDRLQLCDLVNEVDKNHAAGRSVTNMLMRNYIRYTHQINISKTPMGRYMNSLGLTWKPIRAKKKTASDYRIDLLYDFIIEFDKYYNLIYDKDNNQIEDSDYVFVFTDESYIHKGHGKKMTYMREGGPDVNRKSSKGERLVIMHAISQEKILVHYDNNNMPITDTKWTEDTPHPGVMKDYLSCEVLWKASSSTGDYHDNMNSDMFMKWVEEKLIPSFNSLYNKNNPTLKKKMVLICDNAAYHHKREIGSLGGLSKQQLVDKCIEHDIESIDLHATTNRFDYINNNNMPNVMIHPDQDWVQVTFNEAEWRKNTTKKTKHQN